MNIRVELPGMFTTVQDSGRPGHQHEGVTPGGAMDVDALRIANLLVGNDLLDAALEITLSGPALIFDDDIVIALAGADLGARTGETKLQPWRAAFLPRGSALTFDGGKDGARAYLAVTGGIDVPVVLGSRSTHTRAAFGGYKGRTLAKGDVLQTGTPGELARRMQTLLARDRVKIAAWGAGPSVRAQYSRAPEVRVVAGSHLEALTDEARRSLLESPLRVSARSDRMGVRLEGARLTLREPLEILSEAVAFGTVQLPPDGDPIVLMADRQTTGGYPRLAEVASVDLPLVAQLRTGDSLRFREITMGEAQALYVSRERELEAARHAIGLQLR